MPRSVINSAEMLLQFKPLLTDFLVNNSVTMLMLSHYKLCKLNHSLHDCKNIFSAMYNHEVCWIVDDMFYALIRVW